MITYIEYSKGVILCDSNVFNIGIVTTPMLHFLTHHFNSGNQIIDHSVYYNFFSNAFLELTKGSLGGITVDCANGVGSVAGKNFIPLIKERLDMKLINCGEGILNKDCGADFVKVGQKAPVGLDLIPGRNWL